MYSPDFAVVFLEEVDNPPLSVLLRPQRSERGFSNAAVWTTLDASRV